MLPRYIVPHGVAHHHVIAAMFRLISISSPLQTLALSFHKLAFISSNLHTKTSKQSKLDNKLLKSLDKINNSQDKANK